MPNAANAGTVGGAEHIGDEKRRLLGTGLLLILVMSTGLCLATIGVGVALGLVFAGGGLTSAIAWMAASAWTGSLWRLARQVPRMERRAGLWATLHSSAPHLSSRPLWLLLSPGLLSMAYSWQPHWAHFWQRLSPFCSRSGAFGSIPSGAMFHFSGEQGKPWIPLTLPRLSRATSASLVLGVLASPASVGLFQ